jgi:hypothetical protein
MIRSTLASAALALLVLAPAGGAQAPDGSASRAAIDRLDFMVGRWKGEAWMQRGAEKIQTTMTEVVERRLGGVALLVEGRGEVPASGAAPARMVHHALAVVSFDPQTGTYTMRSYLANGLSGDFSLTPVEGGVQWSREVPGGRVRNTARFGNGEWHEIGEFSRDGTTWTTVMEIKLRREPAG